MVSIFMFGTDQLISIGAEDPKYHAELFRKIPRPANRRLQCPDVSGIQKVSVALSRRPQTLSRCSRRYLTLSTRQRHDGQHKDSKGILETELYIVSTTKMMNQLLVALNTYETSLRCFAESLTGHL